MRKITLNQGEFILKDKVTQLLERTVKPFGTSAKADIPKRYLGKRVYILVLED